MKQIFILTGAGISAESGLKTFRDADGLWEGHRVEDVATPEAFKADPILVQQFYNIRRAQLATVEPNTAHTALTQLQISKKYELTLVTQNVDDLHERAGCHNVIHMHGQLLKKRCCSCLQVSPCHEDLSIHSVCPHCGVRGQMRPHIVWFGEMPLFMDEIEQKLSRADIFISIGTSGCVYPAAGFAQIAKSHGAKTIEINITDTEQSPLFDQHITGKASECLPKFIASLISTV